MKFLFVDTETTGLDPVKNGLIQVAGIVEIDGVVKEEFDIRARPFPDDEIDEDALKINGKTKEEIMQYQSPGDAYTEFINIMRKYVDRYNKFDKFFLVGQNIHYDDGVLGEWLKKCGDNYWYAYRERGFIDLIAIATVFEVCGLYPNHHKKLEDLASFFEIKFNPHDALDDIRCTKEVFYKFIESIGKVQIIPVKQPEKKQFKSNEWKTTEVSLSSVLKFGKHKGEMISDVIMTDLSYMTWTVQEKVLELDDEAFALYESEKANGT